MESLPLPRRTPFWRAHVQKLVALLIWALVLGGYGLYAWANGLTLERSLQAGLALLATPYGPLLYLLTFLIRPLIFFSVGILCIMGGVIFGVGSTMNLLIALVYTVVGVICSSLISFGIGRFLGEGVIGGGEPKSNQLLQRYAQRLRANGFLTVLTMRLVLLPFDVVNYTAAFMAVDWKAFLLATAIGVLPSTFAFVSFGAAIDMRQLAAGQSPQIDPKMIILAILLFALSFLISQWYKAYSKNKVSRNVVINCSQKRREQ